MHIYRLVGLRGGTVRSASIPHFDCDCECDRIQNKLAFIRDLISFTYPAPLTLHLGRTVGAGRCRARQGRAQYRAVQGRPSGSEQLARPARRTLIINRCRDLDLDLGVRY